MNDVMRTIHERRAVRKYKDLPVSKELIDQVIEAGRSAPSAMNRQPWSFYVVTDKEMIARISSRIAKASVMVMAKTGVREIIRSASGLLHAVAGMKFFQSDDFVFHGAPVVIFLTAPSDNEWAPIDIGMCCQNMLLAAKSLGLDSCPIGFGKYIVHTNSYEELRVPVGEQVILSLILGYGDEQPQPHPKRKNNVFYLTEAAPGQ
jgi:nitroreductase